MHCGHIKVLLKPNFKFTISTSAKPAAVRMELLKPAAVRFLTVSSPVPNQQQQPIVEDAEDLIVQAEASEDAIVKMLMFKLKQVEMHMSSCHITLAKQASEINELNRQNTQAIKQARLWQAQAQTQRAKVCKLEAENKELLQELENEDEDAKQQPGESFSQWEERVNFPPGVPRPSWPLSEFQNNRPVPVPKQPVGPPPSYLIKRFQSQTSSNSSQNVLLGLNKAMAIGKTIGKNVVKGHAKETWKKAPVQ